MTKPSINKILQHPARLTIAAMTYHALTVDFQTLKSELDVSDAVLSKHLSVMQANGLVRVTKSIIGRYPKTRVTMTVSGLKCYEGHVKALQAIIMQQK